MSLQIVQARTSTVLGLSCNPTDNPDFQFNYCPSLGAAILFTALFGLSVLSHVFQARHHKKWFCWVLIMGAIWEFISSATRIESIKSPFDKQVSQTTFVFLVLAPLWINAFDYMVLGRMVHYYLPDKQLVGVKAQRFALYFVSLDITSFIVQLVGALTTVGNNKKPSTVATGLHIYTAGVCLQQAVILSFLILCILFQRRMNRESERNLIQGNRLVIALYISLALITYRIIFRIIEFSAGNDSVIHNTLDNNEWYMYVFDEAPMFLALIVFHVYHPGHVLIGPESEYPKPSREDKAARGRGSGWRFWIRNAGDGKMAKRDGYLLSSPGNK
ncbi:hypothetical protein OIDMADRAFT_28273 [Oidiodendron maius Zn]|uniref:RTA1 domain protein n=1 Tax=Oidiodendron maius (strain Zn) TaxID=913774 RepID=A0A0C3HIK2_OIDMZ|nr:hypothetical protein OIDMADRAFT_28273 [Oidiodendron maius Zn]